MLVVRCARCCCLASIATAPAVFWWRLGGGLVGCACGALPLPLGGALVLALTLWCLQAGGGAGLLCMLVHL